MTICEPQPGTRHRTGERASSWHRRAWLAGLVLLATGPTASVVLLQQLPALPRSVWPGAADAAPDVVRGAQFLGAVVLVLALLVYAVGIVVALLACFDKDLSRDIRRKLPKLALAFLVGGAGVYAIDPILPQGDPHYTHAVRKRAVPVIAALEEYRKERGAYPTGLHALIPDYLIDVPRLGLLGYGELRYESPPRVPRRSGASDSEALSYDLSVYCGQGRTLHYWPSQEYPDQIWGGEVERIQGWAYVYPWD